jgi:hypothetical protein
VTVRLPPCATRLAPALLLAALGLAAGDRVSLAIHVLRSMVEVERMPRYGFIGLEVPDADFEGINWRV